jgi:hypothetical protein
MNMFPKPLIPRRSTTPLSNRYNPTWLPNRSQRSAVWWDFATAFWVLCTHGPTLKHPRDPARRISSVSAQTYTIPLNPAFQLPDLATACYSKGYLGLTKAMNAFASSSTRPEGVTGARTDLWSEILQNAERSSGSRGRGSWKRKNVILLCESLMNS